MNHKLKLWLLFLLLALPVGLAMTENELIYTIVEENTIVEQTINFSVPQPRWEITLPLDAQALEANVAYEISTTAEAQIISVSNVKNIKIKYISESFVEITKDRYFTLNLAKIEGKKEITVILPEAATLKYTLDSAKSSIIPSATEITTDGKRIVLKWQDEDLAQANSLLIIYQEPQKINWTFWIIMVFLIFLIFGILEYFILKKRKKKVSVLPEKIQESITPEPKEELTRNLFEEEKAIIEILLKAKDQELWQKKLLFELGISKVKLSRKLRNLEAKDLIERIPFGNTNKIRLKRK